MFQYYWHSADEFGQYVGKTSSWESKNNYQPTRPQCRLSFYCCPRVDALMCPRPNQIDMQSVLFHLPLNSYTQTPLSIYPSIHLSIYPSIHPSSHPCSCILKLNVICIDVAVMVTFLSIDVKWVKLTGQQKCRDAIVIPRMRCQILYILWSRLAQITFKSVTQCNYMVVFCTK